MKSWLFKGSLVSQGTLPPCKRVLVTFLNKCHITSRNPTVKRTPTPIHPRPLLFSMMVVMWGSNENISHMTDTDSDPLSSNTGLSCFMQVGRVTVESNFVWDTGEKTRFFRWRQSSRGDWSHSQGADDVQIKWRSFFNVIQIITK